MKKEYFADKIWGISAKRPFVVLAKDTPLWSDGKCLGCGDAASWHFLNWGRLPLLTLKMGMTLCGNSR